MTFILIRPSLSNPMDAVFLRGTGPAESEKDVQSLFVPCMCMNAWLDLLLRRCVSHRISVPSKRIRAFWSRCKADMPAFWLFKLLLYLLRKCRHRSPKAIHMLLANLDQCLVCQNSKKQAPIGEPSPGNASRVHGMDTELHLWPSVGSMSARWCYCNSNLVMILLSFDYCPCPVKWYDT